MKTLAVAIPMRQDCGIRDHADFLNTELREKWRLIEIEMPHNGRISTWRKIAKKNNSADLVLIHYEYSLFSSVKPYRNCFGAFINSLNAPAIVIFHDLLPELIPHRSYENRVHMKDYVRNLVYLPFFSNWTKKQYSLADHLIVHAHQLRKKIMKICVNADVTFAEHPIPQSTVRWCSNQAKKYTFVTPGFIKQHKGYLDFIKILLARPDWNWLIAGGPQTEADQGYAITLQKQINEIGLNDRVIISGYQSREILDKEIVQESLAVFTYQQVTNSGDVAWAIGAGMPVMTTDLETFTNLKAAHAGLALLPSGQVTQWSSIIDGLLGDSDRQKTLASSNFEFANTNSYAKMADLIDNIAITLLQKQCQPGDRVG